MALLALGAFYTPIKVVLHSMNRRAFIGWLGLAGAVIVTHLRPEFEWKTTELPNIDAVHYQHVTYSLGFTVSRLMLEDDIYAYQARPTLLPMPSERG